MLLPESFTLATPSPLQQQGTPPSDKRMAVHHSCLQKKSMSHPCTQLNKAEGMLYKAVRAPRGDNGLQYGVVATTLACMCTSCCHSAPAEG